MTRTAAAAEHLIPQDTLLEVYPWLSTHKLAQYRRDGRVQWVVGKGGKKIYDLPSVEKAIRQDMAGSKEPCPKTKNTEDSSNTKASGSTGKKEGPDSTDTGTKTTAEIVALEDASYRRTIFQTPKTNSSTDCGETRTPARPTRGASS